MRYFFNIHDGQDLPDHDGHDFATLEEARVQAVVTAGALIGDNASHFWSGQVWSMEVTNDQGLTLFTLEFFGTMAPAAKQHQSPS